MSRVISPLASSYLVIDHVDALTDPAAIPLPPTITAGEAKGLALGLGKLALMGRFSATMDMIKSNIRQF